MRKASEKIFYRYCSFSVETLQLLCSDQLYFARPSQFNDPFDCQPAVECDSSVDDLVQLLTELIVRREKRATLDSLKKAKVSGNRADEHAEKIAREKARNEIVRHKYNATDDDLPGSVHENFKFLLTCDVENELREHYNRGVCCFSSSCLRPLMWSHYGDKHKGICIGYSLDRTPRPVIEKVEYTSDRAIKTSLISKAILSNAPDSVQQLDVAVLLRKANDWKYEDEYRLVGEEGLHASPLLLKEVVFGLRCPDEIKHSVVSALAGRDKKMQFSVMREKTGKYAFRKDDLDTHELSLYYPCTATSGF